LERGFISRLPALGLLDSAMFLCQHLSMQKFAQFVIALLLLEPVWLVNAVSNKPKDITHLTLNRFEKEWARITTYKAKFHQIIASKRLGTREEFHGTITIKKPGMLRWETEGGGPTQILNGNKVIVIKTSRRRKNRAVDIYENGVRGINVRALSFLTEKSDILNNYVASLAKETPEKISIKLAAKNVASPDVFIAEISKNGYLLAALIVENAESDSRIEFISGESNVPIATDAFEYVPQANDVVHRE
jgi:outer membrane lipoprotein-sorting protein